MSHDPSDKALDSTNSLKHHDISIEMLNYEINHKLHESMITCEYWNKYYASFRSIIFRILISEVEILMNPILSPWPLNLAVTE